MFLLKKSNKEEWLYCANNHGNDDHYANGNDCYADGNNDDYYVDGNDYYVDGNDDDDYDGIDDDDYWPIIT